VLIFLLIGLIDVGRYTYYGILAANAARAAVQYGAQNVTTAADVVGMQNAAEKDAESLPNWTSAMGGITVQHLCSISASAPAICVAGALPANTIYYVRVQVTGNFNALVNYPGIAAVLPITGSAIMRVAGQ
jgi:Flp pilus assembly protein TadG